jgi:hypothetical protein
MTSSHEADYTRCVALSLGGRLSNLFVFGIHVELYDGFRTIQDVPLDGVS